MKVTVVADHYRLYPAPAEIYLVRNLSSRHYDSKLGCWVAPFTTETQRSLRFLGIDLAGCPVPTTSGYTIDAVKQYLVVKTPYNSENRDKCAAIPDYRTWNDLHKGWICRVTGANVRYLREAFPQAVWTPPALELTAQIRGADVVTTQAAERKADALMSGEVDVDDWIFKTKPFNHQKIAFGLGRGRDAFAYFMEQGTGKTHVAVNDAAYNFSHNVIDAVLYICPNSVKSTIDEEIATHLSDDVPRVVMTWEAGLTKAEHASLIETNRAPVKPLVFVIMNVESLQSEKGVTFATTYLKSRRCMIIVDESSKFKNPRASRSRVLLKLGRLAKVRRIMSGTPITQGPLDHYAPFKFLNEWILGYSSFTGFRNHYAIMGGFNNRQVVGYSHLDELTRVVEPHCYRVLKRDVLDLPPKMYQKRVVTLGPEQMAAYKQMKEQMVVDMGSRGKVSVTMALTQLLRLQQIVGGFLPEPLGDASEEEVAAFLDAIARGEAPPPTSKRRGPAPVVRIPGSNAKLDELLDILEPHQGKAVVWSRFRPEIELIETALVEIYGRDAVAGYHGGVKVDNDPKGNDRTTIRHRFQDESDPLRFMIAQTQTATYGLTLTAANLVVYFSNTFSLEDRLQTEDRFHRIGLTHAVLYIDLIAKGTLDTKVIGALRGKKNVADLVNGDSLMEWI